MLFTFISKYVATLILTSSFIGVFIFFFKEEIMPFMCVQSQDSFPKALIGPNRNPNIPIYLNPGLYNQGTNNHGNKMYIFGRVDICLSVFWRFFESLINSLKL